MGYKIAEKDGKSFVGFVWSEYKKVSMFLQSTTLKSSDVL